MKKLSNYERLMVLLAASSAKENYWVDVDLVAELVAYNDEWALNWEYDWFDSEPHPKDAVVDETVRIFEMLRHAQRSADHLGQPKLFQDLRFEGFDGNNDTHHHIAKVLVEKLKRFTDLPNASENSHSAGSIGRLRDMLARYEPIRQELLSGAQYNLMSASQLSELTG